MTANEVLGVIWAMPLYKACYVAALADCFVLMRAWWVYVLIIMGGGFVLWRTAYERKSPNDELD